MGISGIGAEALTPRPSPYAGTREQGGALAGSAAVNGSAPARERDPQAEKQAGNAAGTAQKGRFDRNECQTCKNRRYQDGSDDPGVSFKTPGKIDPSAAQSVVRGHEYEHVFRERSKALREGREVVSQSVVLHTGICPECGRAYISGGTTRTVTRKEQELAEILGYQQEGSGQAEAVE
jgi:hypothetical protein